MKKFSIFVAGLLALPIAAAAQAPPAPPAPIAPAAVVAPRAPMPSVSRAVPSRVGAPAQPRPFAADALRAAPPQPPMPFDVSFDAEIARDLAEVAREMARLDMSAMSEDVRRAAQDGIQNAQERAREAQERVREAEERVRESQERIRESQDRMGMKIATTISSGSGDYDRGLSSLQQRQYDRAITSFDRAIAAKIARTDGALYWKAYAQSRIARSEDSLATLAILKRDFPQSRYLSDARVLEADVRKANGQTVDQAAMDANDEIKLYAISGIANTDPERAIPLLEGVLNGSNSLQLKKRAIYVLALSRDTRARQVLLRYAKGAGNPDLQVEAIRYLVSRRDANSSSAELKEIYQATQDKDVRRAVIDAYRGSANWFPINLNVNVDARPGTTTMVSPAVPVGVLTVKGQATSAATKAAADELWTLYQIESDADLRTQMANAFGTMGAVDRVGQIARSDKDANVRARAIRQLGGQRVDATGATLVEMYASQSDVAVRKALVNALAGQNNAEGLVAIARKESDLSLKTDIVRRLSDLAPKNKAAADYLMEVIK